MLWIVTGRGISLDVAWFFFLMIRRPPRSTQGVSSAASDVYKRQVSTQSTWVEQSLETFTLEERLEGPNQYFCELCNKKVNARKCLKVRQFPPIMTLALSRFEIDWSTETREKINDKFIFPLELDITKYKEIPISHSDNLYELKAIIIHRGGAYGGHYHAYIRDEMEEGIWNLKVPEKYSESPKPEEKVVNVGVQKMFTEDPEKVKDKTTEQKEEDLKETTKVTEYNYDECDFPFPYSNPKLRSHWFDFDDSSVTPLPLGRLQRQFGGQSENGYILIYKQKNLKYQFSDPTKIPEPWQNYILAENIKNEETRRQYREEEAHIEVLFQPTELFSFEEESMIKYIICLLYTSPSPRDLSTSRMPSSA
eukprot:TRINITY_DN19002_c0_g1_i2.p1 TRINITY_DN19002_c0_g1~~TRINITY_DN19002_c0_g1_i2.p1  ORF type:complete len:365 (-),score=85.71 TRINITY_DN19002_c0_g1_i2:117-1211(-)